MVLCLGKYLFWFSRYQASDRTFLDHPRNHKICFIALIFAGSLGINCYSLGLRSCVQTISIGPCKMFSQSTAKPSNEMCI